MRAPCLNVFVRVCGLKFKAKKVEEVLVKKFGHAAPRSY